MTLTTVVSVERSLDFSNTRSQPFDLYVHGASRQLPIVLERGGTSGQATSYTVETCPGLPESRRPGPTIRDRERRRSTWLRLLTAIRKRPTPPRDSPSVEIAKILTDEKILTISISMRAGAAPLIN